MFTNYKKLIVNCDDILSIIIFYIIIEPIIINSFRIYYNGCIIHNTQSEITQQLLVEISILIKQCFEKLINY